MKRLARVSSVLGGTCLVLSVGVAGAVADGVGSADVELRGAQFPAPPAADLASHAARQAWYAEVAEFHQSFDWASSLDSVGCQLTTEVATGASEAFDGAPTGSFGFRCDDGVDNAEAIEMVLDAIDKTMTSEATPAAESEGAVGQLATNCAYRNAFLHCVENQWTSPYRTSTVITNETGSSHTGRGEL